MKSWVVASAVVAATAFASLASAGYYAVHIHGRGQNNWTDTMYGTSTYTAVKCNYNGTTETLATANATVRSCLQTYCTGSNSCIIVAYSNGAHQVGYTQAYYPSTITNLVYVEAGGGAAGGSELTDVASPVQSFIDWFSDEEPWFQVYYGSGADAALHVSTARSAYNHELNNGKSTYHIVGNTNALNWIWYLTAGVLPGDDDGVVAFHSAFGCVNSGSQSSSCTKWTGHKADTYCESDAIMGSTDHFDMDYYASWCY